MSLEDTGFVLNFEFASNLFRVNDRWEDEERPESYLIPEFSKRLSKGPINYKLQIQLHEVKPDDSHLILHAARIWDQEKHPWQDLAGVTVTSLLPIEVVERTRCSLDNRPPSLDILPCQTIFDYTSIPYLRSKVYPASNKLSSKTPRQHIKSDQVMDGTVYNICVNTGNRKGAGTDAKVTLTITGELKVSHDYVMPNLIFSCPVSLFILESATHEPSYFQTCPIQLRNEIHASLP